MSDTLNPRIEAKLYNGNTATDIAVTLKDFQDASKAGMTAVNYINDKYEKHTDKDSGTAFEQLLLTQGVRLRRDKQTGAGAHSIEKMLMADGANTSSQALTVSGRMLVNSVIEQMIYSELFVDTTSYESDFNSMIANTTTSESSIIFQPIVNVTAPKGSRMQPIASGAEPATMVSISLSDRSFRIPRISIGLEIDDEAAKNQTIDQVGIILREQAAGQRLFMIDNAINNMISGDFDTGMLALSSELTVRTAAYYDAASTTQANFTNKAFLNWLMDGRRQFTVTHIMCDRDAWWAVQAAVLTNHYAAGSPLGLQTQPVFMNPMLPGIVKFLVVENGAVPAGTLIGIDSSKAIQKHIWAGGNYSASENYVMRRTSAMRFDIAEITTRMLPKAQGWKIMTFA
jgi:hypothetical protein